MITKNPLQFKAIIKKKAAEKHIPEHLVMQNYMLERLLERITITKYQSNFILKGGFLIGFAGFNFNGNDIAAVSHYKRIAALLCNLSKQFTIYINPRKLPS